MRRDFGNVLDARAKREADSITAQIVSEVPDGTFDYTVRLLKTGHEVRASRAVGGEAYAVGEIVTLIDLGASRLNLNGGYVIVGRPPFLSRHSAAATQDSEEVRGMTITRIVVRDPGTGEEIPQAAPLCRGEEADLEIYGFGLLEAPDLPTGVLAYVGTPVVLSTKITATVKAAADAVVGSYGLTWPLRDVTRDEIFEVHDCSAAPQESNVFWAFDDNTKTFAKYRYTGAAVVIDEASAPTGFFSTPAMARDLSGRLTAFRSESTKRLDSIDPMVVSTHPAAVMPYSGAQADIDTGGDFYVPGTYPDGTNDGIHRISGATLARVSRYAATGGGPLIVAGGKIFARAANVISRIEPSTMTLEASGAAGSGGSFYFLVNGLMYALRTWSGVTYLSRFGLDCLITAEVQVRNPAWPVSGQMAHTTSAIFVVTLDGGADNAILHRIDAASLTVTHQYPLGAGFQFYGMNVSATGEKLWLSGSGRVLRFATDTLALDFDLALPSHIYPRNLFDLSGA